jgi:hypothetical protein
MDNKGKTLTQELSEEFDREIEILKLIKYSDHTDSNTLYEIAKLVNKYLDEKLIIDHNDPDTSSHRMSFLCFVNKKINKLYLNPNWDILLKGCKK